MMRSQTRPHRARRILAPALALLLLVPASRGQCLIQEDADLFASDTTTPGSFGQSMAFAGSELAIGAPMASANGAVYVFDASGASPVERQKLLASDGAPGDGFGASAAGGPSVLFLGAPLHTHTFAAQGAVYVHDFDGTTWTGSQELLASDAGVGEGFGSAVAVNGNLAAIGCPASVNGGLLTGAVYLFAFDGTQWTEQVKLTATIPRDRSFFGSSVAFRGNQLLIAAPGDSTLGHRGACYVFTQQGGSWTETQILQPGDVNPGDEFGRALSVSGSQAVITAPLHDAYATDGGAAYLFAESGGTWSLQQKLAPHDAPTCERFGFSATLTAQGLVVGALANVSSQGGAYFFHDTGAGWVESQKLVHSTAGLPDLLGYAVELRGLTAYVAAPFAPGPRDPQEGLVARYSLSPLAFAVNPPVAQEGDPAALVTCGGLPGSVTVLYVVDTNGVPTFVRLALDTFDARGRTVLAGTIPPGTAGLTATFLAFGFSRTSQLATSNTASLSIQ